MIRFVLDLHDSGLCCMIRFGFRFIRVTRCRCCCTLRRQCVCHKLAAPVCVYVCCACVCA